MCKISFQIIERLLKAGAVGLILLSCNAFAAWQTTGRVTRIAEQKANFVVLETSSGARLRVEFFDLHAIRVRLAPNGRFEDYPQFAFDSSRAAVALGAPQADARKDRPH